MAFIILDNKKAYTKCLGLSLKLGYAHTTLDGKDGRAVLAVTDTILDELAERGIAFTTLREAQLPDHLSPGGLDAYRRIRQNAPEHLYFNASLPPPLHVVMACTVPEAHAEAVRQIVGRHEPAEFRSADVRMETIPIDSGRPIEVRAMVRVEFVVPRAHQQAIMDELMASGAAGFSRETAIYVLSDPDGPPRGREDGPRGN